VGMVTCSSTVQAVEYLCRYPLTPFCVNRKSRHFVSLVRAIRALHSPRRVYFGLRKIKIKHHSKSATGPSLVPLGWASWFALGTTTNDDGPERGLKSRAELVGWFLNCLCTRPRPPLTTSSLPLQGFHRKAAEGPNLSGVASL